jgi:hypothetical protein
MAIVSRYIGIDVGENKYYPCAINMTTKQVEFPEDALNLESCVKWTCQPLPKQVCVDSPPAPNLRLLDSPEYLNAHGIDLQGTSSNRRVSEWRLGIGGCYATKARIQDFPGWMKSGVKLYKALVVAGLKLDLGSKKGNLFEYHPTYGFKSLFGLQIEAARNGLAKVRCDQRKQLKPKMPKGSQGHKQRIALLKKLLLHYRINLTDLQEDRLTQRVDWADALFGAILAWLKEQDAAYPVVDPEEKEGGIWIADVLKLDDLSTELVDTENSIKDHSAVQGESERKTETVSKRLPPKGEGALLRLGSSGPGGFTQQDTIETIRSMLNIEGLLIFPVGVKKIGAHYIQQAQSKGLSLWIGFEGVLRLNMCIHKIVGEGRTKLTHWHTVTDMRNPWSGIDKVEYWFFAKPDDVVILQETYASIETRRSCGWKTGVPNNRQPWLMCRPHPFANH